MAPLTPRDDAPFGWVDEDGFFVPWWYSRTGIIVKYSILGAIIFLVFAFVIGGYVHSRIRAKKGLPPLGYHSYFGKPPGQDPPRADWIPQGNTASNSYYMGNMAPPPVYDPTRPPVYQGPPEGGSKVDPAQWRSEPTRRPAEENPAPDYEAPSGPPPAATR